MSDNQMNATDGVSFDYQEMMGSADDLTKGIEELDDGIKEILKEVHEAIGKDEATAWTGFQAKRCIDEIDELLPDFAAAKKNGEEVAKSIAVQATEWDDLDSQG